MVKQEIRRIQTQNALMNPTQDYSTIVQNLSGLESHLLSKIKGQNHVIPRGVFGSRTRPAWVAADWKTARFILVSRPDRGGQDGIDA